MHFSIFFLRWTIIAVPNCPLGVYPCFVIIEPGVQWFMCTTEMNGGIELLYASIAPQQWQIREPTGVIVPFVSSYCYCLIDAALRDNCGGLLPSGPRANTLLQRRLVIRTDRAPLRATAQLQSILHLCYHCRSLGFFILLQMNPKYFAVSPKVQNLLSQAR